MSALLAILSIVIEMIVNGAEIKSLFEGKDDPKMNLFSKVPFWGYGSISLIS